MKRSLWFVTEATYWLHTHKDENFQICTFELMAMKLSTCARHKVQNGWTGNYSFSQLTSNSPIWLQTHIVHFITARIWRMTGGYVLTGVCLSTLVGGGVPISGWQGVTSILPDGGYPHPSWSGVPILPNRAYPHPFQWGYPLPRCGWGGLLPR